MRAVFSQLFGEKSQTSKCLSSWIAHFEFNRVYYSILQEANKSFLSQVLFAIDRALQIYWQSCSDNEDRRAINTRIFQMQDLQNNIERHSFSYILPKVLLNKFLTEPSDSNNVNENGRKPGAKLRQRWCCMKFSVKGVCNKACNRAHKLTPEEEKDFDSFVKKMPFIGFSTRGRGDFSSLKVPSLPQLEKSILTSTISDRKITLESIPLPNQKQSNTILLHDKRDSFNSFNKVTKEDQKS